MSKMNEWRWCPQCGSRHVEVVLSRETQCSRTLRRRHFKRKGEAKAFHELLVAASAGLWLTDERGWPIRPEEVEQRKEAARQAARPSFSAFVDACHHLRSTITDRSH